jgi:hypothetical protein
MWPVEQPIAGILTPLTNPGFPAVVGVHVLLGLALA